MLTPLKNTFKLTDIISAEKDERTRVVVLPKRIVASDNVDNPDWLLQKHSGQSTIWAGKGATFPPGSSILLDFGFELHGSLQLVSVMTPHNPVRLRIRFGESVSETLGEPNNDHAMHDYSLSAANMGTTESGMTAFRFVRIDNIDSVSCSIREIRAVFLFLDCDYLGSFDSSDDLLNQIWFASARTVQLCMQEYLWDAPKRDRLIWMGDIHPEVCAIAAAFGKLNVVERSLDLVRDETPFPRFMNGMISYTVSWGLAHWSWFRAFGDLDYLRQQHDYFKQFIDTFQNMFDKDPDGFAKWGFIDWCHPHDEKGILAGGFQAQCVWSFRKFAELFEALGDPVYAEKCLKFASGLAAVKGNPGSARSVLSHRVLAGMEDPVRANRDFFSVNPFADITPYQGFYLLHARAMAGDFDGALNVIRNYWGGMIQLGSETFWEHFDIDWLKNASRIDELPQPGKHDVHAEYGQACFAKLRNSFCHGWGAGPLPWMQKYILGVQFLSPGGKNIRIEPHLCDLKYVTGTIPTAFGLLKLEHVADDSGTHTRILEQPRDICVSIKTQND